MNFTNKHTLKTYNNPQIEPYLMVKDEVFFFIK